ncbi:MAG: hypothetical protein WBA83_06710 [Burkholderiaceae bacterium]
MSTSSTTYESLQKLIALDVSLLARLYDTHAVADASRIIAASAGRHGMALDLVELSRYLQVSLDDGGAAQLGDSDLAGVAGGVSAFHPFRERAGRMAANTAS